MINKNELRIGNLFQCKIRSTEGEVILPVLELGEWGILHSKHKEIGDMDSPRYGLSNVREVRGEVPYGAANGIPLTPDILEKCGFERDEEEDINGYLSYRPDTAHYAIRIFINDKGHVCAHYLGTAISTNHPQYLHQLQNLFFAVTGEELTVNI